MREKCVYVQSEKGRSAAGHYANQRASNVHLHNPATQRVMEESSMSELRAFQPEKSNDSWLWDAKQQGGVNHVSVVSL